MTLLQNSLNKSDLENAFKKSQETLFTINIKV